MAQELAAGQVWSYNEAEPKTSRVIIGKVDRFDGQQDRVVSIVVTDAPIPSASSTHQTIQHLPVAEESLRKSLIGLEGQVEVPSGFVDGYQHWRLVYDEGKAGYFTIPVNEIVKYVGQVAGQPRTAE
ncbi:hypothetical protein N7E70_007945 [Aminobacter sp. NyZ550]|uniref:hypothetical protein n=1 Tax=Aminobacter sp. NyZ550 TaxID=2979870 RepID=UPI0021D5F1CA|nr:hypothetical protein [Aminobacter sp. NyZ550]WAX96780.1 hypothetical protein N7E70_007945 [Aminobacter sp. NyZ550]